MDFKNLFLSITAENKVNQQKQENNLFIIFHNYKKF
jgi:hypothetical protein